MVPPVFLGMYSKVVLTFYSNTTISKAEMTLPNAPNFKLV